MTAKKTGAKERPGRKGWKITQDVLDKTERYAAQGLAEYQIAHMFGISQATWFKYKAIKPELAESLERGKASGIEKVTNTLFEKAVSGETDTSIIFYLKNRNPSQWAKNFDKPITAPVKVDIDTTLPYDQQINQMNQAAVRGEISWDIANQFAANMANMLKVKGDTEFEKRLIAVEKEKNVKPS
jgi:hypothetical protein